MTEYVEIMPGYRVEINMFKRQVKNLIGQYVHWESPIDGRMIKIGTITDARWDGSGITTKIKLGGNSCQEK